MYLLVLARIHITQNSQIVVQYSQPILFPTNDKLYFRVTTNCISMCQPIVFPTNDQLHFQLKGDSTRDKDSFDGNIWNSGFEDSEIRKSKVWPVFLCSSWPKVLVINKPRQEKSDFCKAHQAVADHPRQHLQKKMYIIRKNSTYMYIFRKIYLFVYYHKKKINRRQTKNHLKIADGQIYIPTKFTFMCL